MVDFRIWWSFGGLGSVLLGGILLYLFHFGYRICCDLRVRKIGCLVWFVRFLHSERLVLGGASFFGLCTRFFFSYSENSQ
jgi:hypothetical protein